MSTSGVRIVVFDLGGVIVRICRSWQEACAAAGEPYHPAIAEPEAIARRKPIGHRFEIGAISAEEYFTEIARVTQGLYNAEQFRRIHEAWILHEYPGVHELIDDVHARGVNTGVLSNTNAAHWLQLADHAHVPGHAAKFRAPGKVRHLHASHLLGLAKPDRAIYDAFANQSGHAPREILFFDDLLENVQAAREAGWHAEQIDHLGDPAAQMRAHLLRHGW